MKGSGGYVLAEALICLAAAVIVCISAVSAYTGSLRLLEKTMEAENAFKAASGALNKDDSNSVKFDVERQKLECPGTARPLYYITVRDAAGAILASVVTSGE